MARKKLDVTISAEGRDFGKVFRIHEMPASQAERWAIRAFLAMAKSGVDVPDDVADAGMAGLAAFGLKALSGVSFELAGPLMDEMFECVKIVPDPKKPMIERALIEDDIEEVKTRLYLRKEIFTLHTGFFSGAVPSK